MSFLDDAKKTVAKAVNEHGDKIKDGLGKAGREIDKHTDGKYTEKIERGTKAAGDALDKLRDETSGASATPDPEAPVVEPESAPGTFPGKDPGGASEPGTPTDPQNPTG